MTAISDASLGMLLAIHSAVRRDLERILGALDALADADGPAATRAADTGAVVEYWSAFAAHLHHHHSVEDTEVWPHVRSALGARADEVLDAMEAEHGTIVEAEATAGDAMTALVTHPHRETAAMAAAELRAFREVVTAHLAHEEKAAVPLILEAFSDEAWQEFQGRRQQDPGTDAFLPWVLDGAPVPAVDRVTGALPPPVRDLLLQQWLPAHDRRVQAVLRIG